jgi:ComF family protein
MNTLHFLKNIGGGLVQLFYPQGCAACGIPLVPGEEVLCLGCVLQLPYTRFHHQEYNRAAQHFAGRIPLEAASSFLYFTKEGVVQQLMHSFKYKNQKDVGRFLGQLFAAELSSLPGFTRVDALVPVPLHRKRRYHRGYNQAGIIAASMAAAWQKPVFDRVLLRSRHTESQTHKSRRERIVNVRDAFEVKRPDQVAGKHLLLVDDVLTTGATLESCARALLQAGCARISIATLALAID